MLPNNSDASLGLVVMILRNISAATTEPPNRYDNTSWNALKKINGRPYHTIRPEWCDKAAKRVYAPSGNKTAAKVTDKGFFSVQVRINMGNINVVTKIVASSVASYILFLHIKMLRLH